MNLSPSPRQRFFDANGVPLAGGQLFTYAAGTTTPQATYSNAAGTANANPVVLDASGFADIWLDPSLAYKFVLEDSGNNVQWTVDNITSTSQGVTSWNANTVYAAGALVTDSSGKGLIYASLISNNQNNPLSSVSAWGIFDGNIRTVSTNTTLAVTDNLVRSNSTGGNLTQTLPPCSTTPIGKKIEIKDIGTGGNTTSVKGSGTDTVDGNNTYTYALTKNASLIARNNGSSWDVLTATPKAPSVSVVTASSHSGGFSANSSGTYTVPTSPSPLYIRVRMVGGGGGGGGTGSTGSPASGGNGGQTTFGTTLLTANGGNGGSLGSGTGGGAGGVGGTASLGTGPVGLAVSGGQGQDGSNILSSSQGGAGSASALGGGGGGGFGGTGPGHAGATNSGAGGGGGGGSTSGAYSSGAGGGAGGYIDAIITNGSSAWAATYAYGVGAAGGTGTAGSNGNIGAAGASGQIIVEEFYE